MHEKNIASFNLYNLNRRNHTTLVPKLFLMAHHLWVPYCHRPNHKFSKPDLTQCGMNEMAVTRAYKGCVRRIGSLRYLILMCKMQTLIRSCKINSLICVLISKLNHCLNEKNCEMVPCKYRC